MRLWYRPLALTLTLALLCPAASSCAGKISSDGAKAPTVEAVTSSVTFTPYPCETDPDFTDEIDYTYLSRSAVEALPVASEDMTPMERRKLCLDFFKLQLSFLWETNLDVTDYDTTFYVFKDGTRPIRQENLYAGVPYQAGGYGSLYRILEYYDEKTGVLDLERAFALHGGYGEGGELHKWETDAAGNITYKQYRSLNTFFNQCSSGANWAWGRVINSVDFAGTGQINVANGYIPLGFTYFGMENIDRFGEITDKNPNGTDADDIAEKLGSGILSNSYALLRPADCLVSSGHVMMVQKVNLARLSDGSVDPARSTVSTLEQIENWGGREELCGRKLFRQGGVNRTYTFIELMEDGYLPFTFIELLDENDPFDKPQIEFYNKYIAKKNVHSSRYASTGVTSDQIREMSGAGVEKARVFLSGEATSLESLENLYAVSNYAISDLFVRVLAEDGSVLVENIYRPRNGYTRAVPLTTEMSNARSNENGSRPTLLTGVAEAVEAGGRLEISLQLSTGELLQIKGFDF